MSVTLKLGQRAVRMTLQQLWGELNPEWREKASLLHVQDVQFLALGIGHWD